MADHDREHTETAHLESDLTRRSVRGGAVGDLLCKVVVETPVNLSGKQKELLKQLDESMQNDRRKHSPQEGTWMAGVKKFFDDMKF